jgi:hypothetical protein
MIVIIVIKNAAAANSLKHGNVGLGESLHGDFLVYLK